MRRAYATEILLFDGIGLPDQIENFVFRIVSSFDFVYVERISLSRLAWLPCVPQSGSLRQSRCPAPTNPIHEEIEFPSWHDQSNEGSIHINEK